MMNNKPHVLLVKRDRKKLTCHHKICDKFSWPTFFAKPPCKRLKGMKKEGLSAAAEP